MLFLIPRASKGRFDFCRYFYSQSLLVSLRHPLQLPNIYIFFFLFWEFNFKDWAVNASDDNPFLPLCFIHLWSLPKHSQGWKTGFTNIHLLNSLHLCLKTYNGNPNEASRGWLAVTLLWYKHRGLRRLTAASLCLLAQVRAWLAATSLHCESIWIL